MTEPRMSEAQFTMARALAHQYGHTWGTCPSVDPEFDLRDPQEIQRWCWEVMGNRDVSMPGILAPTLVWTEESWTVEHTTMTGRLSWTVTKNGNVTLEVWRPGNIKVAHIDVLNDDSVDEIEIRIYTNDKTEHTDTNLAYPYDVSLVWVSMVWDPEIREDQLHTRHVRALEEALFAVFEVGLGQGVEAAWGTVTEVLKPLYSKAVSDLT